jgi:predicted GIY-YIG superfamily endonuclease
MSASLTTSNDALVNIAMARAERLPNGIACVHVESCEQITDAIEREKEIKAWRRSKKDALVETTNPTWADLLDETIAEGPSLRSG